MSEKPAAEVMLRDVLFAHWPIAAEKLRSVVPDPLSIDTFDGSAWITVLVVDIAGARVRAVPYHPSLPSINLRTYVSHGDETGIYFIALEMDGQLSSWLARNGFGIPYYNADVDIDTSQRTRSVESYRERRGGTPARFAATYRPEDLHEGGFAEEGSREEFLIERTNYYFEAGPEFRRLSEVMGTTEGGSRTGQTNTGTSMFAGAADHRPWALTDVDAEITTNTLFEAAGVPEPTESPVFNYSSRQYMAAKRLRELPKTVPEPIEQ
ncbi:hypothetical protein C447_00365 [Halococcus hamelinensis 100A6]|uniref:DUF2071 domain-containing protein n=2 Tax=Halococcus hamelinensis TaxID=332168 RepID=M0M865_9EURY|nr:hypothetical protein C447_00365 [Halococcus hamelinensis 100A6]